MTQLELGDLTIDVMRKDIKNLHLSVHPPAGEVRISAPLRMDLETVRVFTLSKLGWIKKQQRKLRTQVREAPREYLERESHYVWGKRYLLEIVEVDAPPSVELKHSTLVLRVRPGASTAKKQAAVDAWYRQQLKEAIPVLIAKWEPRLGVEVARFFVQTMKTRWGSCNTRDRNIRLNTALATKPPECLEYVVVHELVHLLEASHNRRFTALMDQYLPSWRFLRDELNRLPLAQGDSL